MAKKNGRPTMYKGEEHDRLLEKLLSEGKFNQTFCAEVGISEDTFYKWVKRHKSFAEALKRGKATAKALFIEKISDAAWDTEKNKVNNGLISLLAVNVYGMSTGKETVAERRKKQKKPKLKVVLSGE
jgi:transposase-like protein